MLEADRSQELSRVNRSRDAGRHRWIVRHAKLPTSAEAVLHIDEPAVNELPETFHHWTRTHA